MQNTEKIQGSCILPTKNQFKFNYQINKDEKLILKKIDRAAIIQSLIHDGFSPLQGKVGNVFYTLVLDSNLPSFTLNLLPGEIAECKKMGVQIG